jgi:hypothetical protein
MVLTLICNHSSVKQRAKLTRFRAKTASKIDHPKNVKILHLNGGKPGDDNYGNASKNTITF